MAIRKFSKKAVKETANLKQEVLADLASSGNKAIANESDVIVQNIQEKDVEIEVQE